MIVPGRGHGGARGRPDHAILPADGLPLNVKARFVAAAANVHPEGADA